MPQTPAFPGDLLVSQARDLYLVANGFSVQQYAAPAFTIGIFGIPFKFPNIPSRKRAIPLHDLHHVLTGYSTEWIGEAEIGAWELRAGCNSFITYYLNGWGVLIGLFISPRRVWRAFRSAHGQRTLYRDPLPYDQLIKMTVSALRSRLKIPPRGI